MKIRKNIIQELCCKNNLTTFFDFGYKEEFFNFFVNTQLNYICIEIEKLDIKNDKLIFDDYKKILMNLNNFENTLFVYFCFEIKDLNNFIKFFDDFKTKNFKNCYLILWLRFNNTQDYKIFELENNEHYTKPGASSL
jgi:hypothetical protein